MKNKSKRYSFLNTPDAKPKYNKINGTMYAIQYKTINPLPCRLKKLYIFLNRDDFSVRSRSISISTYYLALATIYFIYLCLPDIEFIGVFKDCGVTFVDLTFYNFALLS